ncbi:MAG TPA: fumarylacetoacetate hydrolase family protein [Symbiobacteriaceae bacterium]|nr:fumarylacetoacetate hydrolase family protein [Symbiobacteriaceae bacterium]
MLLVTFWLPRIGPRLGLVREERVYDLTAADPVRCASLPVLFAEALDAGKTPAQLLADLVPGLLHRAASYRYADLDVAPAMEKAHLMAPPVAEVWAAGVTYLRSRDARVVESDVPDIYTRVYEAERPEIFFKASSGRVSGQNAVLNLRSDSKWNVPEPELGVMLDGSGRIVGYTVGNDMSSRDIEGVNPLYLPQAKMWKGSCAVGPAVLITDTPPSEFIIHMTILRGGKAAFEGEISTRQMKRTFPELVSFLNRDNELLGPTVLLTGTCLVPDESFTLLEGDVVEIAISGIGTLRNPIHQL